MKSKYLIQDKSNILYSLEDKGYSDNLIPTMTSNITPSGVASASGQYDDNIYPAWKAFSGTNIDMYDCWASQSGSTSGWLQYDFGENNEKTISKYSIVSRKSSDTTASLKTWTFEGLNPINNSWDILDKRENEPVWNANETREYIFNNTKKYRYYRINISSNHGNSYICIGQLQMYEKNLSCVVKITNALTEDLFRTKGFDNPTIIRNGLINQKDLYGIDKGVLGEGKMFEFSLSNDMKLIQDIE